MSVFAPTILADERLCTACMACELACGFRWTRTMDPTHATIRVTRNDDTGLVDVQVMDECDACRHTELPFCVAICAPRALSLGRKRDKLAIEATWA